MSPKKTVKSAAVKSLDKVGEIMEPIRKHMESAPAPEPEPLPSTKLVLIDDRKQGVTASKDLIPADVTTFDSVFGTFAAKLSPAQTRSARDAAEDIKNKLLQSAENMIGIAERLIEQRSNLGEYFDEFVGVLNDSGILARGTCYTMIKQAEVFIELVPNATVRKYFGLIGKGQGIVVRTTEGTGKSRKTVFNVSAAFAKALEVVPPVKGTLNDDLAELYVRKVLAVAGKLRATARKYDEDKAIKALVERFKGLLMRGSKKDETAKPEAIDAAGKALTQCFAVFVQNIDDLELADTLVGQLKDICDGKATMDGQFRKSKSAKTA